MDFKFISDPNSQLPLLVLEVFPFRFNTSPEAWPRKSPLNQNKWPYCHSLAVSTVPLLPYFFATPRHLFLPELRLTYDET